MKKDHPLWQLSSNMEIKVTSSQIILKAKKRIEQYKRPTKESKKTYIAWEDNDMDSSGESEKRERSQHISYGKSWWKQVKWLNLPIYLVWALDR